MTIANRITEAANKYLADDYENCLIQASIAIAATATTHFPKTSENVAYKQFLHENMRLITMVAFQQGRSILNIKLAYKHPELKPDSAGLCTIEQILYHVIRCGLVHAGKLPCDLILRPGRIIQVGPPLILPSELLMGMIMAVVASCHNAGEHYPDYLAFGGVPFGDLAGKADAIFELVQS